MRTRDALALGASRLPQRPGLPDPRREATWLLAHAWGVTETRIRVTPEAEVPEAVAHRYLEWLTRRAAGEPAHHLTASCPFFGRELAVSPAVLIPRPETELLVEMALRLDLPAAARVLDVGTGSGCIGLTLAAERPGWRVVACDVSLAALAVARLNRRRLGCDVSLLCDDLTAAVGGPFDLVTANLPYIPRQDLARLPLEVRRDPALALDGGGDGLGLVRRLVARLPQLLAARGCALLELGEGQAEAVAEIATAGDLAVRGSAADLGGVERVIRLQRP